MERSLGGVEVSKTLSHLLLDNPHLPLYLLSFISWVGLVSCPQGTRAKKVTCEIHPGSMKLTVEGVGVVTEGEFEGKVSLDGCYWSITDLSLDPPPNVQDKTTTDEMRQGPVHRGETSVQVFLEKRKPFNTLWRDVFKEEDSDLGKPVLDVDTIHGGR